MYEKILKRFLDIALSFIAILILSPVFVILIIAGAFAMRGNPFFVQKRPGKIGKDGNEKIFNLIKFRTMDNRKDEKGALLHDEIRLNNYGKLLRKTSLDELPELFNILIGNMSIVGPRPLLVQYISRYTSEQRRRHEIRPGITGYAQAYGRNSLTWEEKFEKDVYYVDHISFMFDAKIVVHTILAVLRIEGISSETSATMEEFMGAESEEKVNA